MGGLAEAYEIQEARDEARVAWGRGRSVFCVRAAGVVGAGPGLRFLGGRAARGHDHIGGLAGADEADLGPGLLLDVVRVVEPGDLVLEGRVLGLHLTEVILDPRYPGALREEVSRRRDRHGGDE